MTPRRHPPAPALIAAAAIALGACASAPAPRADAPPAGADAGADALRLPAQPVRPAGYRLELTVDPAADAFSGRVEIALDVAAPAGAVTLHAVGLALGDAAARDAAGEQPAQVQPAAAPGAVTLAFARPLAPGRASLSLAWRAPLGELPEGLYRVQVDGRWYAYTQLEPLDARRAFPCFDEPGFKTPFEVTLRVPAGLVAAANAPEAARERVVDEAGAAWDVVRFLPTPPLPTYLVAVAVGAFDVVEAPADAFPGVPLRTLAVRGQGGLAGWTLEQTPAILGALTAWFGRPYPFRKLDQVAVPNFAAGAMENAGLVTYRERLLLLDPARATEHDRYAARAVIAHELAHQWFGNLVTLAWWDDLWLNEAFASWMEAVVLEAVDPALEADLDDLRGTGWVMGLDAQRDARAVRQPIRDEGDIHNAFDGITYTKGNALIRMTSAWLGADTFREGVRAYLDAHAGGSATTGDLLAALERASGKPVTEVLHTFLDHPGVPLVDVALTCDGEGGRARLRLAQRRFRPAGAEPLAPEEPWRIPICVRYGLAGAPHRECFVLAGPEATERLAAPGCPAWLHPNADERGYYRWSLPPAAVVALAREHREALTAAERVALPGHLTALLEAERLDVAAVLDALGGLAADAHPLVAEGVAGALDGLGELGDDPALRPAFAALAGRLLGPALRRVGPGPRDGESARVALLRPALLRTLADVARDDAVLARARAAARDFVRDPASVRQDELSWALPVAAWEGDDALWRGLRGALDAAATPQVRSAVLAGLASFGDEALLRRSLGLLLDGTLRAQDVRTVLGAALRLPPAREVVWRWLVERYDALVALLGEQAAPRLPMVAAGLCTPEARAEVAAFFGAAPRARPGTERNLGLALERIDRCVRLKGAIREPLARYLGAAAAR